MTLSFDEYLKNNKGALVQNDATKPVNPVDECPSDVTGGDADTQREKVNKDNEKKDASHGDKATVVSEAKEDIDAGDEKDDDQEDLNESAKEAFNRNRSAKVGDKFVDTGKDEDTSGTIVFKSNAGIMIVAYEYGQDTELLILDTTYKYSEMITLNAASKSALKKFL